ncbi:uncharacterized protein LOC116247690 [Nymphaea colorata]|uniref:uncharacterized protein LOC116247690 n=1 Tax=Nymphaea colorata TaxID=210225 RepID=UPI00129E9196|nr:uncharacterized protein LOC116247690 [Nymphaea colorata]
MIHVVDCFECKRFVVASNYVVEHVQFKCESSLSLKRVLATKAVHRETLLRQSAPSPFSRLLLPVPFPCAPPPTRFRQRHSTVAQFRSNSLIEECTLIWIWIFDPSLFSSCQTDGRFAHQNCLIYVVVFSSFCKEPWRVVSFSSRSEVGFSLDFLWAAGRTIGRQGDGLHGTSSVTLVFVGGGDDGRGGRGPSSPSGALFFLSPIIGRPLLIIRS